MRKLKEQRGFAQKLIGLVLAVSFVLGLSGVIYAYDYLDEAGYVIAVTLPAVIDDFDLVDYDEEEEFEYELPQVERPELIPARPSAHSVWVDGELIAFRAFNIGDRNFFMLRDIAYILNGSYNQFEVTWDLEINAISITTGIAYTPVGGEMPPPEDVDDIYDAWAWPGTSFVYVDGVAVYLHAYNIGGNNFFMLRDLGEALGFNVDWDEESASVLITTVPPAHIYNDELPVYEDDEDDEE